MLNLGGFGVILKYTNLPKLQSGPPQPESQLHFAPVHPLSVQLAVHVPWPLQCSLSANPAFALLVEQAHRLHALSQAFILKKSLHDFP